MVAVGPRSALSVNPTPSPDLNPDPNPDLFRVIGARARINDAAVRVRVGPSLGSKSD